MPTCSEIPTKRLFISVDSEPMVSSFSAKYSGIHHVDAKRLIAGITPARTSRGIMSVDESSMVEYKCILMPVAIY